MKRAPRCWRLTVGLGLLVVALCCAPWISAQTVTWNNAAGGSYDTAGNWTPSGIPGSGANLEFNLNNSYLVTMPTGRPATNLFLDLGTVTFASSGAITNGLVLSQNVNVGTGLLNLNDINFIVGNGVTTNTGRRIRILSGRMTADNLRLAVGGGDGSMSLSGASSALVLVGTSTSFIGQNGGSGTLSIINSATATFGGTLLVAGSGVANSTGMLTVGTASVRNWLDESPPAGKRRTIGYT